MSGELDNTKMCECGVEIFFGRCAGKHIPLERKGVIVYVPKNEMNRQVYGPVTGYMNHFFTCPLSKKFRKRKPDG